MGDDRGKGGYNVKKIFLSGPITGREDYRARFAQAAAYYRRKGCAVLNPAELPEGMEPAEYMRICLSMIDVADAVVFLPGMGQSPGSNVERAYAYYARKEILHAKHAEFPEAAEETSDARERAADMVRHLCAAWGIGPEEVFGRDDE